MSLKVKTIVNNPISSNCHIIYDNLKKKGLVIDPGSEDCRELISFIKDNNISIDFVILTHEHFDHTWSTDKLNAIVLCTDECRKRISDNKQNLSFYFNQVGFEIKVETQSVEEFNCELNWNGYRIEFIRNEAHSPGGMMFVIDRYVVTGDFLIKDLRTVTKLRWAKKEELLTGEEWLKTLQGYGLTVLAGHGDSFDLDNYDLKKIY